MRTDWVKEYDKWRKSVIPGWTSEAIGLSINHAKVKSELWMLGMNMLSWVQCGKLVNLSQSQIEILNTISYTMKQRIEDLPEKQKKELWETAKKESKHQSKKERIKYAKAIYALQELEKEEKKESIHKSC